MTDNTLSRRDLLKAAPAATALVVLPTAAMAQEQPTGDTYTREEREAAYNCGGEVAYLHVARAWIDRWKALGGTFGLTLDKGGNPVAVNRGMVVAIDLWAPTDEGRGDMRPSTWLCRPEHHKGAVKALEGPLELTPGLRDAVRELGGREARTRWAHGKEA